MSTLKAPQFSFGGVDSRSNPTNYPPNRAIRCVNFSPQSSGLLRLREGYTVPTGPTADGIPIHSAIYYEQFAAAYLGPQFVLYGKADSIDVLNLQTGMINLAPNNKAFANPSSLSGTQGTSGGSLGSGTYYYVVTELDGQGGETAKSNEAAVTIIANRKINLNWTGTGAGSGYNVYRGNSTGSETLLVGTGLPAATNSFIDDGSATAVGSVSITTITAVGSGSPLANILLATPDSAQFSAGQQVTITGSDNDLFNTLVTVVAIVDSSNITVTATAFTLAGTSSTGVSQGPVYATTLSSSGSPAWTVTGGVASIALSNQFSGLLIAQGPPLSIPATAIPRGIEVVISRNTNNPYGAATDVVMQILKAGTATPANRSAVGYWYNIPQAVVYGGPTDLWDETWVPADFSDPTFGAQFEIYGYATSPSNVASVQYFTFKVYYDIAAAGGLTGSGGSVAASYGFPPIFNTTHENLTPQMGSSNPWGHFRSNNRIFISSGAQWSGRFFVSDQVSWDGDVLRPAGLPGLSVFSNATGGPVVVAVTSSTAGSIAPTVLTGYQLYGAIYNPITQHMGNRFALGSRVTVGSTESIIVLTGLPNPYFTDSFSDPYDEWQLAIGVTNDGGEVPYWYVDSSGNNIVMGNSATMGTITVGNVNVLQELPARNDIPPLMDKFARVGTRIFGALSGDPYLKYSNDVSDVSNADYVGNPEESWPADQQEPLPDGQLPTSIHAYRLEGWFFSRENLNIWSQFLLQQGANPWRGPWPGGCCAQRAFIETPRGPFWVSPQKQLCTFMEDGVISVSDEYELSLLGKIADRYLGQTEVGYLLDQQKEIERIIIRGLDANGSPVIIVHDLLLLDERSPNGQGYLYEYGGLNITTFVGAGYTPRQNVYDTNGRMRLWAGSAEGFLAQIEDGLSDNGTTYSADYVGLLGLGDTRRSLAELEYQGDEDVSLSYLPDYSLGLDDFIPIQPQPIGDNVQTQSRFTANLGGEETRWVYLRMQLTSHPEDGDFEPTDPPFMPLPTYGSINEVVLKLGAGRREGR